jgi:glycosyltransferase involved in cell wall biosynthesis
MIDNACTILHLLHQYLPDHIGGVELYTNWLAAAQQGQGQTVHLFHRRSNPATNLQQRVDNGVTIWAGSNGRFTPTNRFTTTFHNPALHKQFSQVLDQTQPDIVHIQHLMGLPLSLVAQLQARRIPYVVTLWDFWWVCANAQLLTNYSEELCAGPQAYLNCARCALARAGFPQFPPAQPLLAAPLAWRVHKLHQVLAKAARVIVPAAFVQNWYANYGLNMANMTILPPGLDYPPDIDMLRQVNGNGQERPLRFGYIGGLSTQKGVHIPLQAFRQLPPTAEFWIAGDPTFDPTYVQQLQRLATPQVHFLGRLNRQAIWHMLAQIDLLIVPSLWYETFAFVISEAFAAGVPVVASDLGVMAERVRHNVDGLLVPPGDVKSMTAALYRFQAEPDLHRRLQDNIQPVQTIQNHAQQLQAIYQEQCLAPE